MAVHSYYYSSNDVNISFGLQDVAWGSLMCIIMQEALELVIRSEEDKFLFISYYYSSNDVNISFGLQDVAWGCIIMTPLNKTCKKH